MTRPASVVVLLASSLLLPIAPASAGPPVLHNTSLIRVRADNHFGVTRGSDITPVPTGTYGDTVTDEEMGTAARATNAATYEIAVTADGAVFDIQTQQSFTVGSTGNLTEGFIHFTLDEPFVYELSGWFAGSSADGGDAYQQRTFLRQFVSPFTTIYLEDETGVGQARWLYVNLSNDTAGGTFNQSGPKLGVLPPGTYEFNYELEGRDGDVDQAAAMTAAGRVTLVLRRALPPTRLRTVTGPGSVRIDWRASRDATSYQLEAGSTSGASNLFNGDVGPGTSLTAPAPAGIYYVRLRSRRGTLVGPPSAEYTFTLGNPGCSGAPPPPTNHAVQSIGLAATLTWDPSPGATSYIVEAGNATGLSNLFNGNVGGVTELFSPAPAGPYFTRVRAVNACGASAPSNEVSFVVGCTAPAPPAGLAFTKIGGVLSILWAAADGAASYLLQAGTSSGSSNAFNGNVGASPAVSFATAGVPAGFYFVRAVSVGTCASSGVSSEVVIAIP